MKKSDDQFFSSELLTLYKISHAIVRHKNVNALLNEVLDILDQSMGAQRATLTLYYKNENALIIEASKGLSAAEKARDDMNLVKVSPVKSAVTKKPLSLRM